ncbi:MAG: BrnT family toxin [Methylothermaceae bacterium]|nr:BrnT family toxin [Methylothermaceae bacterium]
MRFEWDESKRKTNFRKHGIDFADAVAVFYDPMAISIEDTDHSEERFLTLGMDAFNRILVVTYTYREDVIRIISARKAEPLERKQYEN